ncbi:MAG TPA: MFS transporter [Dehalococcoidia bacterium]|nr:MFS transporter [Dehalococcoidia bacterium]
MEEQARQLPAFNRILFASGSLGGNVLSRSRDLWLIFFYAPPPDADIPERIPILTLGILLAVARVIEAIDDPLIGWWSDRTRSRWGRRIPFVVLATPFIAIFAVLLWTPPEETEGILNIIYFFLVLEAFHLFSTLSGGPFESLLPEIAPLSRDRVSIVTWQVFFGTIGAFLALVASGVIIDIWGFQVMAATMAGFALVSRYLALAGAWRHIRRDVPPAEIGLVKAFKATLRNDQFRFFLPSFIFFNMAVSLMTAALPFWVSAILLEGAPTEILTLESGSVLRLQIFTMELGIGLGTVVALLTLSAIIVVLLVLPLVYRLSLTKGKAWVYSSAMLIASLYMPLIAFMGFVPGINTLSQALVLVAIMGLPMSAVFTFPNALQADIIDYDALRTGDRREAIYYGTQATLEKIAGSLFPVVLALLLLLGSTDDNPLGIRLVGPVAGFSSLLGYLFFRGYRLPDQVTAESVRARGLSQVP